LAPRLRTRPELTRRLIVAGLVALALLALGEQAPAAFPVHVSIEGHGPSLEVSVDGQTYSLSSALGGGFQSIVLDEPGPAQREYQVDGSDTTSTNDRNAQVIAGLQGTSLYRLDAFLRDEGSYSRWEGLRVTDLGIGQPLAPGAPLPSDFRLDVNLRRPEAAARVWLVTSFTDRREGLELDRDKRNARWLIQRGEGVDALPRWFFPEQPAPFAAELMQLLGRSAAAAYVLLLGALALAWLARRLEYLVDKKRKFFPSPDEELLASDTSTTWTFRIVKGVALAVWLLGAALVSVTVYHQLPHILDAVSYTFQAGLLASGQLSLPAPASPEAFKGPFAVLWQGRIFSQYPPGAPALYAIGRAVNLEWLVGPLACAVLIGATAWTGRSLHGDFAGLLVLGLGVISPFILFQAGSFLSHPVAGGLLALALAAFVAGERARRGPWYAVCGALLGAAFVSREVASVLFALPLGVRLLSRRRFGALTHVVAFGLPFVLAYFVYNLRETGSPLLLPRMIFDASDHFGFGNGIGFHTRHTLAAGLANTDELLTLLQFDAFGWPPLFTFGLMGLPFLLGRARAWDALAALGFLAFVVAYVGYFYHGIALGPRYYFEAMPWVLLLAGRGVQTLAKVACSRPAATAVVLVLMLNSVFFYVPAELERRTDMSGLPDGVPLTVGFVRPTLFGPQLSGIPDQSLVVTSEWWIYNTALAPLNCPTIPRCNVVFALAPTDADVDRLHSQYPDRTVLRAVVTEGTVNIAPLGSV
jgi:hypothetical protein